LARGDAGPPANQVAAITLANKIARMAWAMMVKGERYKEPAARFPLLDTHHVGSFRASAQQNRITSSAIWE
jgi:hypothetical protein